MPSSAFGGHEETRTHTAGQHDRRKDGGMRNLVRHCATFKKSIQYCSTAGNDEHHPHQARVLGDARGSEFSGHCGSGAMGE